MAGEDLQNEAAYWQNLSGLPAGLSASDYKLGYLQATTGKIDSIDSLMSIVDSGNEYHYWFLLAGSPSGSYSISDLKVMVFSASASGGFGANGYGVGGYGV